jgi:hypothetical protein
MIGVFNYPAHITFLVMENTIYLENMIVLQPTYGMDTTHYCRLKVVPYTSGKIWSFIVVNDTDYCLNNDKETLN